MARATALPPLAPAAQLLPDGRSRTCAPANQRRRPNHLQSMTDTRANACQRRQAQACRHGGASGNRGPISAAPLVLVRLVQIPWTYLPAFDTCGAYEPMGRRGRDRSQSMARVTALPPLAPAAQRLPGWVTHVRPPISAGGPTTGRARLMGSCERVSALASRQACRHGSASGNGGPVSVAALVLVCIVQARGEYEPI
jgi:hypothetical protein